MFFENLRAVIDLFSDFLIASEIGCTTFSFSEGWMVPSAGGDLLSEFLGVGNGADELFTGFPPIVELSTVDHLKTGDTDSVAGGGEPDLSEFFPAWVLSDSGQGMEIIDHKLQVGF